MNQELRIKNQRKIIRYFIFLFFLCSFLLLVSPIRAHSGGGPPFLKINGQFAQTNPYYQETRTTLQIPQDIPPESYLINQPITFAIDIEQMNKQTTITSEMVKDITFRWSFASGENFSDNKSSYHFGDSFTQTFKTAKSYLVILEGKTRFDDEYILLDTVQINVLPSVDYQLPQLSVFIGVDGSALEKPVMFISRPTFDQAVSSKSSLWDFGDERIVDGLFVQQKFDTLRQNTAEYIYHRVVDQNGFINDVGFYAEHFNGDLHFRHFNSMNFSPFTIGTYEQAKRLVPAQQQIPTVVLAWLAIMGSGIFFIGLFFFLIAKQQKKKK